MVLPISVPVGTLGAGIGRSARRRHAPRPTPEENELADLSLIEVIGLGDGHSTGTITVTCQTILITIQETIQITVIQETPSCKHETD